MGAKGLKSRNIALKAVGELCYGVYRILRYCVKYSRKSKFAECGENVNIGNRCVFTEQTLFVGSHVRIGDDCCFKSAHGAIRIGSHVMFGPGVHIHGGDHPVHEIGILLDECEKPEDCDGEVVIEDDCWIGARSIILKGVTIGKGVSSELARS